MMFGFLKDKLKQAVKKLTKDVDEQAEEEVIEWPAEAAPKRPVEKKEAIEEEPKKKEPAPPAEEELHAKEEKKTVHPVDEFFEEEAAAKEGPEPAQDEEPSPEEPKEEPAPTEEAPQETAPTDILYEEGPAEPAKGAAKAAPSAEGPAEVDVGVLEKVEEEEAHKEEQEVTHVIESLEEKKEGKGFFGRIKDVFSKKEEPRAEEEKIVERELLGEGLSEEEKRFVEEQAGGGTEEEQVKPLAEETPKTAAAAKPAAELDIEEEKAQEPAVMPEEPAKEERTPALQEPEEKQGFFAKLTKAVTTKTLTEKQFDEIFWELEVALLEANVAVEVIEKIKGDLKASLVEKKLARSKIEETITTTLAKSMENLFDVPAIDILEQTKQKKPYVIAFFGVNGAGKTTTIAKIAHHLKKSGKSVVLAAGDTFRAAAIQQLEEHAGKLGVKIIKHDYGADAAAVGFDAIKYAESKGIDVVLIDTAGRLHSNVNLMDELAKIIRVCKPDLSLFVGESITGNDCIEQAKRFDEAVGIDGIILTKADVDEKGGAAVSVSYVTKKPILFLGMGQSYDDLKPFEKSIVLGSLGLQ